MKFTSPTILSRRTALRSAAVTGLAAWLARPLTLLADEPASSLPYLDRIGLQLYTVRHQMTADKTATLDAIAMAGYRQVELMSIDDEAVQIASIARDKGMAVHSAFMDFNAITNPTGDNVISVDRTIELAERIGLRYIVFGYIGRDQRDTADKCKRIADAANQAARKTRAAGMQMCYHNHSFEFQALDGGSETGFDIFIERFDPQFMNFELDVFWIKLGGQDPIEMMKRLSGRVLQVHLKDIKPGVGVITDESKVPIDAFQELGDGTIDMVEVMNLAKQIGVRQCHVEQDQSPAPLESISQSIEFLRKKNT